MAAAGRVDGGGLVERFIAPLLLSPVIASVLVATTYPIASRLRPALGVEASSCLCVATSAGSVSAGAAGIAVRSAPVVHVCDRRYRGGLMGVDAQQIVSGAHFLSAGLQSFARGLNDTPKIAALLLGSALAGGPAGASLCYAGVGVAMMAGGWYGARRVGETMSYGITGLNEGQALVANAATAGMVLMASWLSLPVSMTQVAVGSLVGLGWATGQARWRMVRTIALSWLLTLPCAAALGAAAFIFLARIR